MIVTASHQPAAGPPPGPADLPPSGSPQRWPWLQQLRRLPHLEPDPWLASLERGDLAAAPDWMAVLAERLDAAAQLRLMRWWCRQPQPDPAIPAAVLRERHPASAAWLREQLAGDPAGLETQLSQSALAALLPLLGHQRQPEAWPLLVAWLRAPIATPLRRAALEGVALGLPVWPRTALVGELGRLVDDLDPGMAATAVDLLARLPAARALLLPIRERHLDPAVAQRLERRLAATPAQPLLLVVHGRSGGELPRELLELAAELEQRRRAPVRLQALTAEQPPRPAELLREGQPLTLVPLLLLPGGHVRHDLPAIVRHWRSMAPVLRQSFLGAWPGWQQGLRQEVQALGQEPILLHHPLQGGLAARYLAHLGRVCGARCLATPYSAEHLAELQLALGAPALPLVLAANRLTDQLADRVGPPLLQRPRLRRLLIAELEALP